jgi:hypothetical protein
MRKVLGSGSPEDGLEGALSERTLELEAQAAALEDAIADLERRESLLRDSRASLERLLRLGTSDLDSRESELAELIRLRAEEAELTRRRSELGAVELKRAALEQRERAVTERELAAEERERRLEEAAGSQHEQASDGREAAGASDMAVGASDMAVQLAFVPGDRYRLVEIDVEPLPPGASYAVEGVEHVVTRVGPSPLPGDARRCAYLVRGVRGASPAGGSS